LDDFLGRRVAYVALTSDMLTLTDRFCARATSMEARLARKYRSL